MSSSANIMNSHQRGKKKKNPLSGNDHRLLDECRALWGKPEQACQGLQLRMHSSYTRVPFRTSCRGVEVGVAFSERVMASSSASRRKRKAVELDVSDIKESFDGATVHGVVVELSPVKTSRKDSAKKYFSVFPRDQLSQNQLPLNQLPID